MEYISGMWRLEEKYILKENALVLELWVAETIHSGLTHIDVEPSSHGFGNERGLGLPLP